MLDSFTTQMLQVGDRVRVLCHNGAKDVHEYVGEVIKKTPKGKVDVKYSIEIVARFSEDGMEYPCKDWFHNHHVEIKPLEK